MVRAYIPDSERFCKVCGVWCGDQPRRRGPYCPTHVGEKERNYKRAKKAGTFVLSRHRQGYVLDSDIPARIARAERHKVITHGGNVPKDFMERSPA